MRRAGLVSGGRVEVMEQHDAAWHHWRAAGVTGRTLVHVDAHHDMWWVADPDDLTIANFLALAISAGTVERVFWVVPDPAWASRQGVDAIARHVRRVARGYPDAGPVHATPHAITTTLLGTSVVACPLAALPHFDHDVLLDIDIDYLLIPQVSGPKRDRHRPLPWCWPNELVQRLGASGITSDLVTIAYSVDGGYTPLKWKHLGDELRDRLTAPEGSTRGWDLLRQAAEFEAAGAVAAATGAATEAAREVPDSAAPHFALARLSTRRRADPRQHYRTAVRLDPSYRTPYAGAGFPCLWDGDLADAEREFRGVLDLDPEDPFAALGMAQLEIARRQWAPAAAWIDAALADPRCEVDGQRALGAMMAAQGRTREAIAAYEGSLLASLHGREPIGRPLVSDQSRNRLPDPEHGVIHARLSVLYAELGNLDRAINGYRIAIVGGNDRPALRARLAWWLWRGGDWRGALVEAGRAVARVFGWAPSYADKSARIASRAAASMAGRLG
jgi:tetratricopeptide (TPR) repeat protein